MNLISIGVVRSDIVDRKAMPPLGAPARVEIHPQFEDGLHRFEKHSHIWVVVWLEGQRDVLQVKPRGLKDDGPQAMHGVFAVRSPARPNPIGLTAARVIGREGRIIHLDRLDFVDGTQVLDIKPYFVSRDCIFSATNLQIGKPASRDAMRESLLMQAENYAGRANPDTALAVRIVEHFRATYCDLNDLPHCTVTVPEGRPGLVDAIRGITRSRFGNASLATTFANSVRFSREPGTAGSDTVYLLAEVPPESLERTLTCPESELFQVESAAP